MSGARSRLLLVILAVLVAAGATGAFLWRFGPMKGGAPLQPAAVATLPTVPVPPPPSAEPAKPDVPPAASQAGNAGRTEVVASEPPPSFDLVRVEKSGETVIAGRAAPGVAVELLRDGTVHARAVADAAGQFAIVPPDLAPGSHELTLRVAGPEAARTVSAQSVTVVVSPGRDQTPLVTVTAPDRPTLVLSQPDVALPAKPVAAAPAAAPAPLAPAPRPAVRITTAETEGSGRLYVSGEAPPGSTLRLYLNDSFVAPATADPAGRISFSIGRGLTPGEYRIRLDALDPASTAVIARAEVPFSMPAAPVAPPVPPTPPAQVVAAPPEVVSPAPGVAAPSPTAALPAAPPPAVAPQSPRIADAAGSPPPVTTREPASVVIPEVSTTTVSRGDNLWRISKRIYGQGTRYTVIFGANTPQIRDPDLIYPGQVFVVPNQ